MSVASRPTVSLRVLLFASYADLLGRDAVEVTLAAPATVGDVVAYLQALPGGDRLPPRPLCARNLQHANSLTPVEAGDEIAVLPPLAGG